MTSHQQSRAGEVPVCGGRMTSGMTRRGDRLLRPMGPWSPARARVPAASGGSRFRRRSPAAGDRRGPGSPDLHRRRRRQRPGLAAGARAPAPAYARTDLALRGAGRLIRELHTAAAGFQPRITSYRSGPRPPGPGEIVSHGDLGPWNTVYRDGIPVAFIDWDAAQPAGPLADLAAAAQAFVPLAPPGLLAEAGFDPLPDLAARLRTFLDGYGLADRTAILPELQRCALDEDPSSPWLRATLPDLGRGL